MNKVSDVFKSIRFAKDTIHRDKKHSSTDDEEHYSVGEKEFQQQVDHIKKMAMQESSEFLKEMMGAGMDARKIHKHLVKNGWQLRKSGSGGGHDVYTHPHSQENVAVPRHKGDMRAPIVLGIMKTINKANENAKKVNEEKDKDPCWKGYEMVGMKKKGKKEVPNCVPIKESRKTEIVREIMKKKKADSDKFVKDPILSSQIMKEDK
jgi:predicted RNA binding protein YcfA (HicA-like mRNA interferase family)